MRPKVVVLIESGNHAYEIRDLTQAGYSVVYLTSGMYKNVPEYLEMAEEVVRDKRLFEPDYFVQKLDELSGRYEIACIFTTGDFMIPLVTQYCKDKGYRNLDPSLAQSLRNKHEFREKQRELGFPVPSFRLCRTVEEGEAFLAEMNKALVFKPVNGNQSEGIRLVYTTEELQAAYETLQLLSRFTKGVVEDSEYLLEEYIPGPIFSCEFIKDSSGVHMLGVTNRYLGQPPSFVESGFIFPYQGVETEAVIQETYAFIERFQFDFGPCHIEYIMDNDGRLYILEVNPRLFGFPCYWLINQAMSINIFASLADLYVTGEFTANTEAAKVATLFEYYPPTEGYISIDLQSLESSEAGPLWVMNHAPQSRFVSSTSSNNDTLLSVLTSAATEGECIAMAQSVCDAIEVTVRTKPKVPYLA
ncbi:ATP-grasp domain-containing protein [Paenibacillus kobensis]|uniref:ATP-grasp domain-containing protein n=1 Tax=Paenibacillus kobensis TaxID=59841 RepID=UPI000FD71017|nr:ATP-grasp domain-containing protein [Paenibacillus kobensis]